MTDNNDLTNTEKQIVQLIKDGKNEKMQMLEELGIVEGTLSIHLLSIRKKGIKIHKERTTYFYIK